MPRRSPPQTAAHSGLCTPRLPPDAPTDSEARGRLEKVPSFARGLVKRIYTDYARERGIEMITPVTMDQARADLGLEDM